MGSSKGRANFVDCGGSAAAFLSPNFAQFHPGPRSFARFAISWLLPFLHGPNTE
jgi:hypothetical protein